jgi:hypothetical protein
MSTLSVDMIEPVGSTLTLGQSGDTVTIPVGGTFTNSGTATGFASGNTYASQWRLHTNLSCIGAAPGTIVAANWEMPAVIEFPGVIGSGSPMVVNASTGAWTFPDTGVWEVFFQATSTVSTAHHTAHLYIYVTDDSGSNWVKAATCEDERSVNWERNNVLTYLFKVADKTTDFIRFSVGTSNGLGNEDLNTDPNVNKTYATFIKLGDAS